MWAREKTRSTDTLNKKRMLKRFNKIMTVALLAPAVIMLVIAYSAKAGEKMADMEIGEATLAPVGWVEFCREWAGECKRDETSPVDAKYSEASFEELNRINRYVNETIKPMADIDHYGVIEKWTFPADGYGDCEDYVLLKRRMLILRRWPSSALLVTVVRDKKNEDHAVLTVRTDKGEFILDNQENEILPWAVTGYRYVKRQSQSDPNIWVSLGDTQPTTYVAAPR